MNPTMMTEHQKRIAEFMRLANQELPDKPTIPSVEIRILRAKLILEETLETIEALGICVVVVPSAREYILTEHQVKRYDIGRGPPDLNLIADGCADISVVTIGTLLACGIADKPLLEEVDRSNLAKFELPKCPTHGDMMLHSTEGMYRCTGHVQVGGDLQRCGYQTRGPYRREDGKFIKGPYWKEPDIVGVLAQQGACSRLESWTPEQFEECKDQLVAFQEFKAAEELVKVIRKLRAPGSTDSSPIPLVMPRENKTPHCHHCRAILSNKLVSNMIERNVGLPCPDCRQLLNLISVVYA